MILIKNNFKAIVTKNDGLHCFIRIEDTDKCVVIDTLKFKMNDYDTEEYLLSIALKNF